MTSIQLANKNKGLVQAFRTFKKRYLNTGKKPEVKNLLAEDLYHTMRLEGEKISRKQARALFRRVNPLTPNLQPALKKLLLGFYHVQKLSNLKL